MNKALATNLNERPPSELFLLGVTHALQTLASVLLDTEEKRAAAEHLLHALSEDALHSELTQDRKARYLEGLSALGIAATHARRFPGKP